MPDKESSENIKATYGNDTVIPAPPGPTVTQSPELLAPINPTSTPAQSESASEVHQDIKTLESRVGTTERWMAWLTGAIAVFTLALVIVGLLQWSAVNGQLAEMKSGAQDTSNLVMAAGAQATAAGVQAGAAKTQADDISRILKGTFAAMVNLDVSIGERGRVELGGSNVGRMNARDVTADLKITVKNWPQRFPILGPMTHHFFKGSVGNAYTGPGGPAIEGRIHDPFTIPGITPEIARDLLNGDAFITAEWSASYDNGFGEIQRLPSNHQACIASISMPGLSCPNFSSGGYGGSGSCDGIETIRNSGIALRQSHEREHCQNQKQGTSGPN